MCISWSRIGSQLFGIITAPWAYDLQRKYDHFSKSSRSTKKVFSYLVLVNCKGCNFEVATNKHFELW